MLAGKLSSSGAPAKEESPPSSKGTGDRPGWGQWSAEILRARGWRGWNETPEATDGSQRHLSNTAGCLPSKITHPERPAPAMIWEGAQDSFWNKACHLQLHRSLVSVGAKQRGQSKALDPKKPLTMWFLWANASTSLSLSFLICQGGSDFLLWRQE